MECHRQGRRRCHALVCVLLFEACQSILNFQDIFTDATSAWFTGFDSPVEDKEAFEARVVLTHFSKAVEGLGPSMVLAPCSSALTGVYMIYQ